MSSNDLVTDHDRIYLQPLCCVSEFEGRQWCQDNVWPIDDDCKETGVEYVRADHITTLEAEIEVLREALQYIRKNGFSEPRRGLIVVADTALKGHKG